MVTMRRLGTMGRFGNAIFQRAFVCNCAKRLQVPYELASWYGSLFFDINDPPITHHLQPQIERKDAKDYPPLPTRNEFIGKDFVGWGQLHTSWYAIDKEYTKALFPVRSEVKARFASAVEKMTGTRVGIHLRRGDYGQGYFWITPVAWYVSLLEKLWDVLPEPSLFVATEDIELVKHFAKFNPQTVESLGINLIDKPIPGYNHLPHDIRTNDHRQFDFFADWYLLTQCNVILGGNSTFNFTAAMLSDQCNQFYRSELKIAGWRLTDPWNAHPLIRDRAEDFAIPETTVVDNPYWR